MNLDLITVEDCDKFPGNESLTPYPIFVALKHSSYDKVFRILEFGSGRGTTLLKEVLDKYSIETDYYSIEHDPIYAITPGVKYPATPYEVDTIPTLTLPAEGIYDLVIVDGPKGELRAEWYPKFKPNVRIGTIILVHDYHHSRNFGAALDANYTYDTITEFLQNRHIAPCHINEGIHLVDVECEAVKRFEESYKIVRITGTK